MMLKCSESSIHKFVDKPLLQDVFQPQARILGPVQAHVCRDAAVCLNPTKPTKLNNIIPIRLTVVRT